MLHGIDGVPAHEAYRWIARRSKARVFVDSSKVTYWPHRSTAAIHEADVRLIHLVRDPRGWLASQLRRDPGLDVEDKMRIWVEENARIRNFIAASGMPSFTTVYEDALKDPNRHIRNVFNFLGLHYQSSSLDYWDHQHHGFAANGAASMVLRQPEKFKSEIFVTGDDKHYQTTRRRQNLDSRWMSELKPEIRQSISENFDVADELSHYGKRMTNDGLVEAQSQ